MEFVPCPSSTKELLRFPLSPSPQRPRAMADEEAGHEEPDDNA